MNILTEGLGVSGMVEFGDTPEPMNWIKQAMVIKVSPEMAADIRAGQEFSNHLTRLMHRSFDKMQYPWRYPDAAPRWIWDPFPRWTKWANRWAQVRKWRHYLARWVGDLSYKIDPDHQQWG